MLKQIPKLEAENTHFTQQITSMHQQIESLKLKLNVVPQLEGEKNHHQLRINTLISELELVKGENLELAKLMCALKIKDE